MMKSRMRFAALAGFCLLMLPAPILAQEEPLPADAADMPGDPAVEQDRAPARELTPLQLDAYVRARLTEGNSSLTEAAGAYRQALLADPGSVDIARRSYRLAVLAGDRVLAMDSARILDQAGRMPRDGVVLLLIDALERRKWTEAQSRVDRLEAEGNLSFIAPFLRSWVSLETGDYTPPALPTEQGRAAFVGRYYSEQMMLLALARKDRAGLDAAVQAASDRLAAFGPDERARMAVALVKLGRRDLAATVWAAGQAISPDSFDAQIKSLQKLYRKAKFTPLYALAMLLDRVTEDLYGQGESIATMSISRMAYFAQPDNDDVRVTLARQAMLADFPDVAWDETKRVTPGSPVWLDAQTVQLRALIAQGKRPEAAMQAIALTDAAPKNVRAWRLLGDVWMDSGEWMNAAKAYNTALLLTPCGQDAGILLQEAVAFDMAGNWEQARPRLEKVVELAPDSAVALNHLGYALADRGEDLPRAVTLLEKANQINPGVAAYIDSLGWAYLRSGKVKKALPLIQRAAMLEPGNSELNEHLGDALWASGQHFEARYAWKAALVGLNDGDDEARKRLEDKMDGKVQSPVR